MRMSMFGCLASASIDFGGASSSSASTMMRTLTPRSAARSRFSAARMPTLSVLQMKYWTSIDRCA